MNQEIEYKRFVWEFSNLIKNAKKKVVFLCIGTSKVTGDSVGPRVGSLLKKKVNNVEVIGDLENNLGYEDINEKIYEIKKMGERNSLIVIDSALYKTECIGKIFIQNRGLQYGSCLKKTNKIIGDISIKAVVGNDFNNRIKNYKSLKRVSNEMAEELANIISSGIIQVITS